MATELGIYFAPNGLVAKIVHVHSDDPQYAPIESDYAPHDDKSAVRINIQQADYAASPAINWGGIAVHHSLTKFCLPQLSGDTATQAQAVCDKIDSELQKRASAQAATDAANAKFLASLTSDQKAQLAANAPVTLTSDQQSLKDAIPVIPPIDYALAVAVVSP